MPFFLKSCSSCVFSGGGPGGLSLCVVLGRYLHANNADVHIHLYEAAPEFKEIGAGISIWKRTWSILQALGLDEALGKLAVTPPTDEMRECGIALFRSIAQGPSCRTGFRL